MTGDEILTIQGDIADETHVDAAVTETVKRFGRLDVLVANAGCEGSVKPLLELSAEEFAEVQRINVVGTFLCLKRAAQEMIRTGGGSIVATGSVASVVGVPGLGAYAASKHAIAGLVKVAALELAAFGIRVNAVAPAPIDNEMMRSIESQVAPPEAQEQAKASFAALNAMKRYGLNEEVANAILFLASSESSFVNGVVLPVDGGFLSA